jgi:hypothetical protein
VLKPLIKTNLAVTENVLMKEYNKIKMYTEKNPSDASAIWYAVDKGVTPTSAKNVDTK